MRISKERKEQIRQDIMNAAGRGFREEGYGGLGIDGLAKRAGMTSGAFYGHFSSKSEAFQEVVIAGLQAYEASVSALEAQYGDSWGTAFLDYYLGKSHVGDVACGCAVPGLSTEVMRADKDTKKSYEKEISRVADTIAAGMNDENKEDTWALMALLAGSVMMARCISNPKKSKDMLDSARVWAEKMMG